MPCAVHASGPEAVASGDLPDVDTPRHGGPITEVAVPTLADACGAEERLAPAIEDEELIGIRIEACDIRGEVVVHAIAVGGEGVGHEEARSRGNEDIRAYGIDAIVRCERG